MGLVKTFEGLIAMRVLLGFFEAGLFPGTLSWVSVRVDCEADCPTGCVYLISMYYKRYELQWRLTLFFTASIIAGAFGGVGTIRSTCSIITNVF